MVVFLGSENSKCQVLANFSFLGAEGIGEGLREGRVYGDGGGGSYSRIGYSWQNEQKFCHTLETLASQIVSH